MDSSSEEEKEDENEEEDKEEVVEFDLTDQVKHKQHAQEQANKQNNEQKQTIFDQQLHAVIEPQLGEEQMRFLIQHKIFQGLAMQRKKYIDA